VKEWIYFNGSGVYMRVYIAARYGKRRWVNRVICPVVSAYNNHVVTSSWLDNPFESIKGDHVYGILAAVDNINQIDSSDLLVLVSEKFYLDTDPNYQPDEIEDGEGHNGLGGGRHFEAGYAYAKGKPVIILGPKEGVFHHLPGTFQVNNLNELRILLKPRCITGLINVNRPSR
jgi:hypothetical protein